MNKLVANFIQKGYAPGPGHIGLEESEYIYGIIEDYSDDEKVLGEAIIAYMSRTNYNMQKLKRLVKESEALPDDYSFTDAALWVLWKCFNDRE